MLIFNWWITGEWIVALTMVLLAIFGLRFAGKLRALALRVVVRIASVALGLVGSLLGIAPVRSIWVREPLGPNLFTVGNDGSTD